MASTMDQQSTSATPRRSRNRPPRKEGPRLLQDGISDIIVTPNAKRGHQKPRHNHKGAHNQNAMSPPPLPDQVLPSIETLDLSSDVSASTHKKRRPQNKKNVGQFQQPEMVNTYPQSPPAAQQNLSQATPVKAMQMYAGPTFHASPAASSLPMPKFFSQAMRTERASEPILSTSDDSSGETSSQTGGDSPTLRNSLRVLSNGHTREASPLDIFFNADRQEKAQKARLGSTLAQERAKSASPATDAFRSPPPPQSMKSPSTSAGVSDHQAKTEALKLLLFPPVLETTSATTSPWLEATQRPAATRSTSETSTPTRASLTTNGSPFEKRSFYDSPNLSTPPSSIRPNQNRRPLPPHLRQEILKSLPLDQSPDIPSKSGTYMPSPKA